MLRERPLVWPRLLSGIVGTNDNNFGSSPEPHLPSAVRLPRLTEQLWPFRGGWGAVTKRLHKTDRLPMASRVPEARLGLDISGLTCRVLLGRAFLLGFAAQRRSRC